MKRLLATALLSVVALFAVAAGSASAACVAPYCPAPSATTGAATNVTATSATISGAVSDNGAGGVTWQLQFGTSSATLATAASGSTTSGSVSTTLTGLQPSTTYVFRVTASSAGGGVFGQLSSFTTAAPAPPTPPSGGGDTGTGGDNGSGPNGEPSQNPSEPTKAQIEAAQAQAASVFGAPAKRDQSYDIAQTEVFVPKSGGKSRDQDTPKFGGRTATFDRSSISDGNTQNFLAISCPTVDCKASFELTVTYKDSRGKTRTVTLPAQSLDIKSGDTDVLQLKLPKAVRKALLKGSSVKLKVGVTVDQASGGSLGNDTKTYTLKTAKPKKAKKGSKKG